jgi:hypothetical protein
MRVLMAIITDNFFNLEELLLVFILRERFYGSPQISKNGAKEEVSQKISFYMEISENLY